MPLQSGINSLKYLNENHIQHHLHRTPTAPAESDASDSELKDSEQNLSMRHIHADIDHCPMGDDVAFAQTWYFDVLLAHKSKATVAEWPTVKCKFANPDFTLDTSPTSHCTPCGHSQCCREELSPLEQCSCAYSCRSSSLSTRTRQKSGLSSNSGLSSSPSKATRSLVSFATSNSLATYDDGMRCKPYSTRERKCRDLRCWCHSCEPLPTGRMRYFWKVRVRALICDYFGPEHARPKAVVGGR